MITTFYDYSFANTLTSNSDNDFMGFGGDDDFNIDESKEEDDENDEDEDLDDLDEEDDEELE